MVRSKRLYLASDIVIIVFATTGSERHHSKDKAKHEA